MILKKNIKPKNISFLKRRNCLYISDFRSIGESMNYSIPAMWKYENLLPWILTNKAICVNENSSHLKYKNSNNLIILAQGKDPRESLFKKVDQNIIYKHGIKELWVAVPHPEADLLAEKYNLKLNFSYSSFKKFNDKIKQKLIFSKFTPKFELIKSLQDVYSLIKTRRKGYIKRRFGSGGFTVFKLGDSLDPNFKYLFTDSPEDWYFEELVLGEPYSIQCLKPATSKDIIVFGFTKQHILDEKYYIGSSIYSVDMIKPKVFSQLKLCLKCMAEFINDYEGFFGIDFIIDACDKVQVLEANIRVTAATIPTLISNNMSVKCSEFLEDIPTDKINSTSIILCEDKVNLSSDVLHIALR